MSAPVSKTYNFGSERDEAELPDELLEEKQI